MKKSCGSKANTHEQNCLRSETPNMVLKDRATRPLSVVTPECCSNQTLCNLQRQLRSTPSAPGGGRHIVQRRQAWYHVPHIDDALRAPHQQFEGLQQALAYAFAGVTSTQPVPNKWARPLSEAAVYPAPGSASSRAAANASPAARRPAEHTNIHFFGAICHCQLCRSSISTRCQFRAPCQQLEGLRAQDDL